MSTSVQLVQVRLKIVFGRRNALKSIKSQCFILINSYDSVMLCYITFVYSFYTGFFFFFSFYWRYKCIF